MTGEQDQARLLAERIARRVSERRPETTHTTEQNGAGLSAELSAMRAGLDDLRQKLIQIEARLTHDKSDAIGATRGGEHVGARREAATASSSSSYDTRSPRLSGIYVPAATASHPSREKFGVEEATVAELVDFFEGEKKCELEPGGKPCDHCDMCSSRGF
ncbi:MAG: hypothetical protein H7Y30_10420 [Pyrinomonadaceae bacterium]|nr:hypothetical protein [Pyrinomonadaceae bacterium]